MSPGFLGYLHECGTYTCTQMHTQKIKNLEKKNSLERCRGHRVGSQHTHGEMQEHGQFPAHMWRDAGTRSVPSTHMERCRDTVGSHHTHGGSQPSVTPEALPPWFLHTALPPSPSGPVSYKLLSTSRGSPLGLLQQTVCYSLKPDLASQ